MPKRVAELRSAELNVSVTETTKSPVRKRMKEDSVKHEQQPAQAIREPVAIDSQPSSKSANEFLARLQYFDQLTKMIIDYIPPKFYFDDKDLQDELHAERREKTAKLTRKGKQLSDKSKHKILKLDPQSNETVSSIIKRKFGKGDEDSEVEGDPDAWGRKAKLAKQKSGKQAANEKIAKLKVVLKQRLADMRARRKADEQKKKRETKKQRREENRNKPGTKPKNHVKQAPNTASSVTAADNVDDDGSATSGKKVKKTLPKKEADKKAKTLSGSAPNGTPSNSKTTPKVYNKEGKLIFSRFDLVAPPLTRTDEDDDGSGGESGTPTKRKDRVKGKSKKSLEQQLNKIQKQQSIIAGLEAGGKSEEAARIKSNAKWRAALERSEGLKVRDDPQLIKKSIKAIDKQKKKSAKQWKDRKESVEAKQKSKQARRQKNIQGRANAKKQKKIDKAKKRGRVGKL